MGCENENLENNNKSGKDEIFDEEMEKNNIEILKRRSEKISTSSRINNINQDKEVIKWQIKQQNELIRRIKSRQYGVKNDDKLNPEETNKNNIEEKLNFNQDEKKLKFNKDYNIKKEDNIYNNNTIYEKNNKDTNNYTNYWINNLNKIIEKNNEPFKIFNANKENIHIKNKNESRKKENIYNLKLTINEKIINEKISNLNN